jgi:hypothetical protein
VARGFLAKLHDRGRHWATPFAAGLLALTALVMANGSGTASAVGGILDEEEAIVSFKDGLLHIEGPIGHRLLGDIERKVGRDRIERIEIESPGGYLDPAFDLADMIERRSIPVLVRHECLSACLLIAFASPDTSATEDAVFGFHRTASYPPILLGLVPIASPETDEIFNDFLAKHGVPLKVLREGRQHGPYSMYEVSALKMLDFGVIQKLVPTDFGADATVVAEGSDPTEGVLPRDDATRPLRQKEIRPDEGQSKLNQVVHSSPIRQGRDKH